MFEKVSRKKSKLRLALCGVSGSGKTLSALYIAYGITGNWGKVALIDTEHERGRFYADRTDLPFSTGEFLYHSLTPPYSPERYINAINAAASAVGEDGVIIIDSFSHAWDNEGGVLDIKSEIEKRQGKNSYSAWDEAGKIQNSLTNAILSVNAHTIVTLRVKMAYAMEVNDKGRTVPVKIGLAPVQRDNTEYEFDIVMNISRNHIANTSKDTSFLDGFSSVITPDLGTKLREWLDNGVNPERCTDCGKIIMSSHGRTAEEIIKGSFNTFNKKLCFECTVKEVAKRKEEVK